MTENLVYDYYKAKNEFPSPTMIKNNLNCFRDLIAYRIVISLPKCHIKQGESRDQKELEFLYQIAEDLPGFIEEKGFTPQLSGHPDEKLSIKLSDKCRAYYRDYVIKPRSAGYRSLHITFYDNLTSYSMTGELLSAMAAYLAAGNNTFTIYNPSPVQSDYGYSTNYLSWTDVTITVIYE